MARAPSREFVLDALHVKEIRKKTGLTQEKFCHLIDVNIGTLRNGEQGRRKPTGPAKALLRAINKDPEHVLAALVTLDINSLKRQSSLPKPHIICFTKVVNFIIERVKLIIKRLLKMFK